MLNDLKYDKTTQSLGASTVLFQQYFDGTPIHGAWVTIHINKKKIEEYGILNSDIQKERMIYPLKGNLRKAWKVKFGTKEPTASWILFIDKIGD